MSSNIDIPANPDTALLVAPDLNDQVAASYQTTYLNRVEAIVRLLRDTADEVERVGTRLDRSWFGDSSPHTVAAHDVIQAIQTLNGNLHLGRLAEIASQADVALARRDAANATRDAVVALPDVDTLAQIIRTVDGNHDLGAGALAEKIIDAIRGNQS